MSYAPREHAGPRFSGVALAIILIAIAAIVALAVYAWSPWDSAYDSGPGQGGNDNQPGQQMDPGTSY
jgi:hypothetical protein